MPSSGTVYRVNEPDVKPDCAAPVHIPFNWTDGANALRVGDIAGGDISGTFANLVVNALHGVSLSTTAPTTGQVLTFNGSAWAPASPAAAALPTNGAGAFDFSNPNGFVSSASGSGVIPVSGAGTRLMWYANKYAFRAGQVSGIQWDDANVGLGSVAFGQNNTASGVFSLAAGHGSVASGASSTAIGAFASASGSG